MTWKNKTNTQIDKKDLKIAEVFQAKVGRKLAALCVLDSDVDPLANNPREGLLSTVEEVLAREIEEEA